MILLYFLGGGAALLFLFLYFRLRKADFAKWPNPYDREMKEPYVSLFSTLYRPRPGEERRRREFRGTGGPEIPPASLDEDLDYPLPRDLVSPPGG